MENVERLRDIVKGITVSPEERKLISSMKNQVGYIMEQIVTTEMRTEYFEETGVYSTDEEILIHFNTRK